MANLPNVHLVLHQHFVGWIHVARRSDRAWAGLSTDLMVERVLMRSMKTSGGLTRGRVMTEQQRLTWLLAMPACAEVNRVLQELSGAKYSTNEQNKETGKSRQPRDLKDTHALLLTMSERNPFAESTSLRNIVTGVNVTGDVDVCRAKEIGQKIMDSMTGIPVAQYTFKRSDQVTTLQSKSSVRVDGQPIQVNPELLLQHLIVSSNAIEDRKALFRFELCSYPSALFDDTLMLRAPPKAVLPNAIWTCLPPDIAGPTGEVQHMLDGGTLLHRITWPHGFPTYQDICALYCDYLSRNFGPAIVVFDGYRIPSTKYTTHQRRTGGKVGTEDTFTGDMKLTMSKDVFLSNVADKHNFIDMLSHYLQLAGCLTEHAEEDVDLLIEQTAVQSAATKNTLLVADDTDRVILLCYYADPDGFDLFMQCSTRGDNEEEPHLGYQSHPK